MRVRNDYLAFGKPDFGEAEISAVARVMRSGWVGMGPEVIAFERELAAFMGAADVVTVNSCTSALFLALLVRDIGPGDEVICPSMTWCSTANAALWGFLIFYLSCAALTWYFYSGPRGLLRNLEGRRASATQVLAA